MFPVQKEWDVIIAGGGVMGSAAAWWLMGAEPSLRLAVVEPDPTYARSAPALSVASAVSATSMSPPTA